MAYQGDCARNQYRPCEDEYSPCEEQLNCYGDDRAHNVNEKPAITDFGEAFSISVIVDKDFESDAGDEPGLDPFEDQHAVHLRRHDQSCSRISTHVCRVPTEPLKHDGVTWKVDVV